MLGKIMTALGVAAFVMGFWEAQSAIPDSPKAIEAGLFMLFGLPLSITGIWVWRKSIKKCPACAERINRDARICKYCRSAV